MVELKEVSFRYENGENGTLSNLSLSIPRGQCLLLCGESGCGKTTLTRLLNGLIPHYYEGTLTGQVLVDGVEVSQTELFETARHVGSVFQNPRSQFFCVDTTSELAFGCENLGLPEAVVRTRIAQAAKEFRMEALLGRSIFNLSGGEKQKVACAGISAMEPELFVLDEPTSNLDVEAIEDLRQTLRRWKAKGKTIVIAEHRLSWLRGICDRAVYFREGQVELDISMETLLHFPPERLARLGLRGLTPTQVALPACQPVCDTIELRDFFLSYGSQMALDIPALSLPAGAAIAVIGHNGAGKSTFSRCMCGLERRFKGTVRINGTEIKRRQLLKICYMVMQDVNHQLFCETVEEEVRLGIEAEAPGAASSVLEELDLSGLAARHPMSLSGGQKQRTAIASALLAGKKILFFDEPTSGLDFRHMEQVAQRLVSLRGRETTLIITHDPELIARCCTHILHLEHGKVLDLYPLTEENIGKFRAFFYSEANKNSLQEEPAH
ncbi:ABC transporter ATP-binding protein [Lawsonibacter faecis]|uniref:ABC transporter ATP-binding protein n=1 Tax=Lawsonibacter faecis TaxID=2763052 RepID=A0A8J6MAU0_9FIRM|nr:ABC transporter ATP-binding protein [Lawsonibacter faecis]MBC5735396.1 ABC transporter ATP-binding protein [Lawsonibacter faecis]